MTHLTLEIPSPLNPNLCDGKVGQVCVEYHAGADRGEQLRAAYVRIQTFAEMLQVGGTKSVG